MLYAVYQTHPNSPYLALDISHASDASQVDSLLPNTNWCAVEASTPSRAILLAIVQGHKWRPHPTFPTPRPTFQQPDPQLFLGDSSTPKKLEKLQHLFQQPAEQ